MLQQSVSRGLAAVALAVAAGLPCAASAQPNIVFIISDDAGWADFGFNDQGNGEVPTPALDSIANRGRWFRAAYTAPVCSPSRARTFLGQHNQRTGYDNNAPDSTNAADAVVEGLRLSDTTMFERLGDRGYSIGYFGKWHLGTELDVVNGGTLVTPGNLPPRHGIDYFWGLTSGSRSYFIGDTSGYSRLLREQTLDPHTNLITDTLIEGNYPNGAYLTDIIADEVADFITDRATQPEPFFVVASFTAPHGPLQATPEYFARADALGLGLTGNRRTYTAMMIAFDDGVQTILDRLEDPNNDGDTSDSIVDSTFICFMNDNGGETANTARNFPLRGKKSDTFDGGIRVMMTMAGPGIPPTGQPFDFPVDSVDLTPTFLAVTGTPIAPDDFTDGVNLLPFLDGTLTGEPRADVYVRGNNPIVAGAREGDFKLTIENIGGPFLYNIATNPGENGVLNASMPERVESMTDIMNGFEAEYTKPRWGASDVNTFDGFVYRAAAVGSGPWSAANAWTAESGTPSTATLFERDGYANLSVRFPAASTTYTAANDRTRPNGLSFIANAITFDGTYAGAGDARVTVSGFPIMLADTLAGQLPTITLDTTSTAGAYPADIALDIRLWDDLIIDGAGSEALILSGSITAERDGRAASKLSSNHLRVTGTIDLPGQFDLNAGTTAIVGDGTIAATPLRVGPNASLTIGAVGDNDIPNFLGNRSGLDIATPAAGPSVELAYNGIETVGSLAIDAQPLPEGVYSASTHPQIFTGPGSITIRGPINCTGDLDDNGFADVFDTLAYLRAFDAEQGCGQSSTPPVAGITVNTEARADTPGDGFWEVTAPGTDFGRGWTFGGAQSPVATDAGAPTLISSAYAFPDAAAAGPDYEDPSRTPSTIELWINPTSLSGNQIIWEAGGGSRGAAIWLSGNELRLDVQNGIPAPVRATTTLSPGWHQITAVIDTTNAVLKLFVDGQLRDTRTIGTDRWAGGNPSGLGQVTSSAVGNITPPTFNGQIGIYRAYNTRALSDAEVALSYDAVINASAPCTTAADLNADGILTSDDVIQHLQDFADCGD